MSKLVSRSEQIQKAKDLIDKIKTLPIEERKQTYYDACVVLGKLEKFYSSPLIKELAKNCDMQTSDVRNSVKSISDAAYREQKEIKELAKETQKQNMVREASNTAYFVEDEEELRMKSLMQLAMRNKEGVRGATEYVKTYLLEEKSIYTIRGKRLEVWIYQEGIYIPYGETYIKKFCSDIFGQAYTESLAKEVIDKVAAQTYIDQKDFFDKEPKYRICVENGILDLLNHELEPFTPDEFHFCKIPVTYDSSATCKKIKKFFSEVLKNPDTDLNVVSELAGWLLMKDYKPEKAVMFMGGGRNGKGKSIKIFENFIGLDNYSSIPITELDPRNNQYASSGLMKKLANFGGDVSEGMLYDTSVIRSLTGRDAIDAQRKHMDSVKFVNYAKLIFAANKPPAVKEDNAGWWARWVWLDFPYTFLSKDLYEQRKEEPNVKLRDPDIVSKILDDSELSGMLNWALEGLQRLHVNNDFSDSNTANEIRTRWIKESNSFEAFCIDHLEESYDTVVEKAELRRAYSVYCRELKKENLSDDVVKRILQKRYGSGDKRPTRSDGDRPTCWTNICFKTSRTDHPDHPKISYSVLGVHEDTSDFYRVKNFIGVHESKSVGGLVDYEVIKSALKGVDVDAAVEQLKRDGDIIEPKPSRYKLL